MMKTKSWTLITIYSVFLMSLVLKLSSVSASEFIDNTHPYSVHVMGNERDGIDVLNGDVVEVGGSNITLLTDTSAMDFFRSMSRFGKPKTVDDSSDYLAGILYAGLPWMIVGVVFVVAAFVMMLVRFTCSRSLFDYYELFWATRSTKRQLTQGILINLTVHGIIACVAVAEMANYALRQTSASVTELMENILTIISSTLEISTAALNTALNSLPPNELDSIRVVQEGLDFLSDTSTATRRFLQDAEYIADVINTAALVLYYGLMTLGLLVLLTVLFLTFYWAARRTYFRVMSLLFVLVPMILSWVLLYAAVTIGVASSDACYMTNQYLVTELFMRNLTTVQPDGSPIYLQSEISCPNVVDVIDDWPSIEEDLSSAVDDISRAMNVNASAISSVIDGIDTMVTRLDDCGFLLSGLGRAMNIFCGSEMSAAPGASRTLFGTSVTLSFLTVILYGFALFGMNLTVYGSLWPLWSIDDEDEYEDKMKDSRDEYDAPYVPTAGPYQPVDDYPGYDQVDPEQEYYANHDQQKEFYGDDQQQQVYYEEQPQQFYEEQPQQFYEEQPQQFYEEQPQQFYEEQPQQFYEEQPQQFYEGQQEQQEQREYVAPEAMYQEDYSVQHQQQSFNDDQYQQ